MKKRRKEGRKEGRKKRRKEGRKEEKNEGKKEGKKVERNERWRKKLETEKRRRGRGGKRNKLEYAIKIKGVTYQWAASARVLGQNSLQFRKHRISVR